MSELAFLDRYREVRKRLNAGSPPKPKAVVSEEIVAKVIAPKSVDEMIREQLLMATIHDEGISYRQALLKGCEGIPKRIKLAILPVLEETNYSWEDLFRKNPETNRNPRKRDAVQAKWEIFKILHYEFGMTVNRIAQICDMDHTSVFYGLGLLKKKGRKEKTDDRG